MKKLIHLAFALLISTASFAQGFNVQVCTIITGSQPIGPIVANLTYYSNGVSNTMSDTLINIQLPYTHCFASYVQLLDSGSLAYATGFVQLSSCGPGQAYNYAQFISGDSTITVNAQNCQNFSNCTTTLAPVFGTNNLIATSTGIGPFSYSWDGGLTYTTNNQIAVNGLGIYCVYVLDSIGCQSNDCYTYSSGGACQAAINVLGGGPYILTATGNGTPPLSYTWSTGDLSQSITANTTGYYCLNIVDALGCGDSACVYLTVGNNCNVNIVENLDSNGVNYLNALIDSTFSGTPTYTWQLNGAPIAGANGVQLYPNSPGQYCVTVDYGGLCQASNCYSFNTGNPFVGCSVSVNAVLDSAMNNSFTFYAYPTGIPPFNYSWMFSDGTTSTAVNPSVQFYNNAGINWANLTVTDSTGCVSSYSSLLPFLPPSGNCYSNFSLYGNYQFGNPGEVFFQSYTQNSNPGTTSYSWDFGDGTTSTLQNPQHIFASTGFYNVCLTTAYNGCTYTSCNNEYVDLAWWNNNPFQGNCTASFMILTNQVNSAGMINIINTSLGNNSTYTWSFGNGFISNNPLPFTTINNPGIYEICLSIYDSIYNCSDTFCDTITIDSLGNVYRSFLSGNIGILVSGAPQPGPTATAVEVNQNTTTFAVTPNPSNGLISLNTTSLDGLTSVEVIDLSGKQVFSKNFVAGKGLKNTSLDLQNIADGHYLIRVISNNTVQTGKIIINH